MTDKSWLRQHSSPGRPVSTDHIEALLAPFLDEVQKVQLNIFEETSRAGVLRQPVELLGVLTKLIFLLSPPSEARSVDTEDICCLGFSHSIVLSRTCRIATSPPWCTCDGSPTYQVHDVCSGVGHQSLLGYTQSSWMQMMGMRRGGGLQ